MIVPLPEIGRKVPPLGVQNIFTSALRASVLIVANDSGAVPYGLSIRVISPEAVGVVALETVFEITFFIVVGDVAVVVAGDSDDPVVVACDSAPAATCVCVVGATATWYEARCMAYARDPTTRTKIVIWTLRDRFFIGCEMGESNPRQEFGKLLFCH